MKKLIGKVSVDSGQVLLVDPCYLSDYKANEFNSKTGVRKDSKMYWCWMEIDGHKIRWDTPIKSEGGKCMNDLVDEGWERFSEYPDKGEFSYSGLCGVTCDDIAGEAKASGFATCVVSTSGYGDGDYPVFAHFDKDGRVKKLEIIF